MTSGHYYFPAHYCGKDGKTGVNGSRVVVQNGYTVVGEIVVVVVLFLFCFALLFVLGFLVLFCFVLFFNPKLIYLCSPIHAKKLLPLLAW